MKKGEFVLFGFILIILILLQIKVLAVNYYVQEDIENGGNYTSLESCLLKINSTLDTCNLNQSNAYYVFNKTYAGGFYFNETAPGNTVINFKANVQNVIIDFNGSNFTGGATPESSYFIVSTLVTQSVVNVTIANFSNSGWNGNLLLDIQNLTLKNINISGKNGLALCYGAYSNGVIVKNVNVFNCAGGAFGIGIYKCKNILLQNVNVSGNAGAQLLTNNQAYGNITIRDSFFYDNGAGTDCVQIQDQNVSFINNTVKYCNTDDKIGFKTITNVTNLIFENNTVGENSLNIYIYNTNNSLFRGNKFGATYDNNFLGVGFGASIGFVSDYNNNLVINNTFRDQIDTGITLLIGAADGLGLNTSITQNRFYNTYNGNHLKDIYVHNLGLGYPNNISIWLNHFYGPNGTDTNGALNVDWCVGDEGNFYNESFFRYDNQRINETDCGLMNLTQPDGLDTIINGTFNLQWTKQSSINTINYSIYYKSANASTWKYLASTISLNYSWVLEDVNDSNDYLIKIVPNDGVYNATNDNSTRTFTIDNTYPVLTLSPSTETSLDLGATKDISCSASDSLGIRSFSLTIDGTSFGTCTSTLSSESCSDIYTMGNTNSKTVSCSTTDKSGKSNSKSITISYTGSSGGAGGGGGGGGSSTSETIENVVPTLEESVVTEQTSGQSFNIVVDNVEYKTIVNEIGLTSTQLNVAGNIVELVIGETKSIDLNNDDIKDVDITLDRIKNGNVELSIKLKEAIIEEKPQEITKEKVEIFYESINKLFANVYTFFENIYNYIISLF